MYRQYVEAQLQEACDALVGLLDDTVLGKLTEDHFQVQLAHVYHHLNTAWNARHENPVVTQECSAENFQAWRRFPKEFIL